MILKKKLIFVLEDEITGQAVISMAISSQGGEVILDHWGDRSLTSIRGESRPFDLLVLDLMLPGRKTGYDILAEIRKLDHMKDVPVVIVSGADPDIEVPRAQERGVNGFICKPIDRSQFPHQLLSIIEGGEYWDEG